MKLIIDALTFQDRKAPGYQSFLFNLLDYMAAHRSAVSCEEIVIAVRAGQESCFERYAGRIAVSTFKVEGVVDLFIEQNRFARTLGLQPSDVILYTYNYASLFRQARSILVVHDLQYLRFPAYWPLIMRWQRKLVVPRSISLADRVIAISQFTRNEILSFYGPLPTGKVEVIRNFCNFAKFDQLPTESDQRAERSLASVTAPYFLCVSSFNEHKNIICLLHAFHLFIQAEGAGIGHQLALVGSFEQLDPACKAFVEATRIRDRIVFAGFLSDAALGRLYQGATAFVLPTRYEGLGMPIVEALYFNKPVLLSDLPICHEVAGPFGRYFDPDDPVALAALMHEVVSRATDPAPNSRRYVVEKFEAANTSQRYVDTINQLFSSCEILSAPC